VEGWKHPRHERAAADPWHDPLNPHHWLSPAGQMTLAESGFTSIPQNRSGNNCRWCVFGLKGRDCSAQGNALGWGDEIPAA
jgi:hypothetical protein